tara:strand:- start:21 stop:296 length:276 start_codon:yes stop_codon:yes gene_type:complete
MSLNKVLETETGKFIFGISIVMICLGCIIFKIFCICGTRDVRQRSKIVPHEKKKEDISDVQLTINPYNFVKVIETKVHTIHENVDNVFIEI